MKSLLLLIIREVTKVLLGAKLLDQEFFQESLVSEK